jgi:hypothetical protein
MRRGTKIVPSGHFTIFSKLNFSSILQENYKARNETEFKLIDGYLMDDELHAAGLPFIWRG